MSVTFEQPLWLLVILLVVPAGIGGVLWFAAMSRVRAWSAVAARATLLTLLAGALAGASAVHTTDHLAVIAVADVSDSVRQFAELASADTGQRVTTPQAMCAWLTAAALAGARGPDDFLGVVAFDGAAAAVTLPRPVRRPAAGAPAEGAAPAGAFDDFQLDYRLAEGTNIEQGLRLAAALFPPDASRRLLLISDGNENQGDALEQARRLAAQGIAVDVLPISYRVHDEVMVEMVDAPPQAAEGSAVSIRVVLTATERTEGTLHLLYGDAPFDLNGGEPGAGRRVTLEPGRNIQSIELTLDKDRSVHRFRPVFVADRASQDRLASNNSSEAFTVSPSQGSVLIIDGVGGAIPDSPGRILASTIERAGIRVRIARVEELPTDLLSYQEFDLVVLQDVAAEEAPRPVQRLLAQYVTDLGGGLVMVGGPDSFGAGGWKGTPIEPILPVNLDLPEQLLVPSAAVMLVIDNSGSMSSLVGGGMRSQQEIANEGAAQAIETLDKSDYLGVIEFNSRHREVVPLARNIDAKNSAARVRAISAGGGTNLYPALLKAMQELSRGEAEKASVRHVIVLSDGRSEAPSGGDTFESLAARMHGRGITVSTISVGDGADDEQLALIATEGGGQFHKVVDPNMLPKIFVKEIRIVRKPLIRQALFTPVDLGSGSTIAAALPRPLAPLHGLVLTQRRKNATVTNILATPEGEPLLSTWFAGRGRVTAFTSDAHEWAADWLHWPGYAAMWTQIVRQTARPTSERSGELTTEIIGDEIRIRYDAVDASGRPMDLLGIPGVIYGPGDERLDVRLSQVGPGVYEARAPASKQGNYFVVLLPEQGGKGLDSVIGGASRAIGAEFRVSRSNFGILQQIAQITGGRLLDPAKPADADLFNRDAVAPMRAASPIWRWLLMWAVAVMVLDVGTRRVAWDRLLSRELARELREQAAAAVRARSEQAAATVASLRRVTARSVESAAPSPPALEPHALDARTSEQRRGRLRAQMQSKVAAAVGDDGDLSSTAPTAAKPPEAETTTSGLLAAKRRAAKRLGDQPEA